MFYLASNPSPTCTREIVFSIRLAAVEGGIFCFSPPAPHHHHHPITKERKTSFEIMRLLIHSGGRIDRSSFFIISTYLWLKISASSRLSWHETFLGLDFPFLFFIVFYDVRMCTQKATICTDMYVYVQVQEVVDIFHPNQVNMKTVHTFGPIPFLLS